MVSLILLCSALFGCSASQNKKAIPVVETVVDVGVEACANFAPQWLWVCKLTDAELDQLLDSLLANYGLARDHAAVVDRQTKESAVLEMLHAQHK